jgi:hypothetical protein
MLSLHLNLQTRVDSLDEFQKQTIPKVTHADWQECLKTNKLFKSTPEVNCQVCFEKTARVQCSSCVFACCEACFNASIL